MLRITKIASLALALAAPAAARQAAPRLTLELRGGANVPTFDIAGGVGHYRLRPTDAPARVPG